MLLDTLRAVREAEPGWRLDLVAPGYGPLCRLASELGVAVQVLPFPPGLARLGDFPAAASEDASLGRTRSQLLSASIPALRHGAALRRLLARTGPDIIHGNGVKANVLAALARPPSAAVVWHVHDYVSSRPVTSRIVARVSRRCDHAVAVSASVAADIRSACGPKLSVSTIHNPVNLDVFTPEGPRADLDALSGLPPAPDGTVRAGLVATMAHWKGHDTFLEAMAAIPAAAGLRGYVVGGPIYATRGSQRGLEELRERARALGLEGRVGFTGFVDRPADAMRALDIVVHASTQPEPFGLVVAEAMACGRAVVAAAAGGVMEFVRPGEDALVHRCGDSAALAGCVSALAAHPELRRRMGEAARRAAVGSFSCDRYAASLLGVYRGVACRK